MVGQPLHAGRCRDDRRVSERVGYCNCRVMIRIRPQQFRIMPWPFMIEIGQDADTRQARGGWVSVTPTGANVAKLVEEGLPNPEIAATLLSRRTVVTRSRKSCGSSVHSRIGIAREPALRAAAPR